MSTNKSYILDRYHISPSDFLGSGMEAEVYAYGNEKVLKVYNHMSDIYKQKILMSFYQSIEKNGLNFDLPCIYDIFEEKGHLITVEKRLEGTTMQSLLSQMDDEQLNKEMDTYLAANIELKSVKLKTKLIIKGKMDIPSSFLMKMPLQLVRTYHPFNISTVIVHNSTIISIYPR